MAAANHHPARRPWYRFTIAGFLVFVLGLGAGLARARTQGVVWPNPLFTMFAAWFVLGMIQTAQREMRNHKAALKTSPLGAPLDLLGVAGPAFAILLIVLAGLLYLDRQVHWLRPKSLDSIPALAASAAISFLFYAGIICGYAGVLLPTATDSGPRPVRRLFIGGATWLLGGLWLSIVLWSTGLVAALVHSAIHGIRLAQPYRRTGVEIYPFSYPEPLTHQFLTGAASAAALAVAAAALVLVLAKSGNRGPIARIALASGWCAIVLLLATLLGWCYFVVLPEWSPIMTPFLFAEPFSIGLAGLLLVIAAALFGARTAAEFHPVPQHISMDWTAESPMLHRRNMVMLLFLGAVAWETIYSPELGWVLRADGFESNWGRIQFVAQMHIIEPDYLVKVAAFLCVFGSMWRQWRSRGPEIVEATVRPARFLVFWGLWFVTGLVAIPALAWFGFSLMFW